MNKDIEFVYGDKDLSNKMLDAVDKCPICHNSIKPEPVLIYQRESTDFEMRDPVETVFKCPVNKCKRLFIAYYSKDSYNIYDHKYSLRYLRPTNHKEYIFNEVINNISKEFQNIYNEAKKAEEIGLKQICGMGYRKALEFLIKDYLITLYEDKKEEIESKLLYNCIKDYVTNVNLKKCAERAVWLGNDETHYIKKWVTKDIEDLKILIDLSLYWIESEELTKQYEKEMIKGSK